MKSNLNFIDNKEGGFNRRLINSLNEYLKKRKIAAFYEDIKGIGWLEEKNINKIINAKILKPSDLKIQAEIDKATEFYNELLELLKSEEIIPILNAIDIDKIRDFNINTILDCKNLYKFYKLIGTVGKRKMGFLFFMPFKSKPFKLNSYITIIEFLLLCFGVTVWISIKRYLM